MSGIEEPAGQVSIPRRSENAPLLVNEEVPSTRTSFCSGFAKALAKYKLEMVVTMVILALVGPWAYPIAHFFDSKYQYHSQCVACFSNTTLSGSYHAWCGDSCLVVDTPLRANGTCTTDAAFCGASHCQALQLIPGVRVVPYWLMVATSVFSVALNVAMGMFLFRVVRPLKRCLYALRGEALRDEYDDIDENNVKVLDIVTRYRYDADFQHPGERDVFSVAELARIRDHNRILDLCASTNGHLWILLVLLALGHLGFLVYHVTSRPDTFGTSGWHQYLAVYALWLNSGTVAVMGVFLCGFIPSTFTEAFAGDAINVSGEATLVTSLVNKSLSVMIPLSTIGYFQQEGCWNAMLRGRYRRAWPYLLTMSVAAPLVPALVVQVIPGAIIFLPVALLILAVWCALLGSVVIILLQFNPRHSLSADLAVLPDWSAPTKVCVVLLLRILSTFIVIIFFQTLSNYALLFYGGMRWDHVIVHEYNARNTECYANALLNNLEVYNIGLAGLLLS